MALSAPLPPEDLVRGAFIKPVCLWQLFNFTFLSDINLCSHFYFHSLIVACFRSWSIPCALAGGCASLRGTYYGTDDSVAVDIVGNTSCLGGNCGEVAEIEQSYV